MVKKYQVLSYTLLLIGCSGIINAEVDSDVSRRLYNAIDTSNIEVMKRIIKRLVPVSVLEKKNLSDAAQDVIDEKQENISLLRSPRDAAKLVAASPFLMIGGLFAWACGPDILHCLIELYQERKKNNPDEYWVSKYKKELKGNALPTAIGTLAGVVGGYLMFKGIRCSTAVAHREKAETIASLIKNIRTIKATE